MTEAKRQLDNTNFYTKLDVNPTATHSDIINNTIRNFIKEKLLSEHIAKALTVDNPKTARFYLLPKIHKINNPGRPITNAINSPTSSIAEFVDYQLKPIVQNLKSYIKDTTDFLNKLEIIRKVPEGAILVTIDVTSLNTNIAHNEGINAATIACEENYSNSTSTRVIIKFLSLVLNLNNFTFNDENILQIKGCSMGSKCSCSYANLFMGKFEKDRIYPLIANKCLCYYRFVDDIFMIWTGSEKEIKYFFTRVNCDHVTIIFECKYSNKEINFLDTIVCITRSNTLITKLYKKEADRNAYLHYKSYHPSKLKGNNPYGQFLRIRRICSNDNDTDDSMEVLKSNFNKRGYPEKILQQQLIKAKTTDRKELLKEKEKISSQHRVHFTTTFNKNLPAINSVLDKHWHLLQTPKFQIPK